MTDQDTPEVTAEPQAGSAMVTDVAQLQQILRQSEVDRAYWQGKAEALEKELRIAQGLPAEVAPAAQPAPPAFSPDKLLALLPTLLPLLSNPEVLKLILPVLKNLSAPRTQADG